MTSERPPVIGVLALQGAFEAHEEVIASLGFSTRLVRRPEDVRGIAGMILPGGESTTMGKLLESSLLLGPVRNMMQQGLPVFGTCAGMILLAERVIDGRDDQVGFGCLDMTVRRNAYGRQVDSFETSIAIGGIDHQVPAIFIRAPMIEELSDTIEVLARVGETPCLVRSGRILAASFHPELSGDPSVHRLFLDIVVEFGQHGGPEGLVLPVASKQEMN